MLFGFWIDVLGFYFVVCIWVFLLGLGLFLGGCSV